MMNKKIDTLYAEVEWYKNELESVNKHYQQIMINLINKLYEYEE